MNIYYANTDYKPGDTRGRNAHIRQFIRHSLELGHTIWLDEPVAQYPRLRTLAKRRLERWWSLRQMDIIYTRLQEMPALSCRYAVPPRRWWLNGTGHVWEFNTIPEFHRIMGRSERAVQESIAQFRAYGKGCDLAICVSEALRNYVQTNLGIKYAVTVPNGSDSEHFRPDLIPALPHDEASLRVVWIGSADLSWHHFGLMVEAAKQLWNEHRPEITFHVIGHSFPIDQTPPNVIYHGPKPYEELPHWLAAMDVGLVLYRPGVADYNSPLKLFDYMASGLAVIATPQPQVNVVLQQMEAIDFLVPFDDASYLVERLLLLASDRSRRLSLGQKARRLVESYYNWQRVATEIFSHIDAMFKQKGSRERHN
ncbi:glycosyltransferase family 4 protein [Thermanaerothrix sp. 4228-RoL]|uniref:Glycosyltransferase family 4 protein n=1 Tax=Thermanaerothrix solaris TaxID=3058434 RepID=A0ABU3NJD5_9CHLR|nr:glycosyltransferase family 4 protein [Thermanaerothrix sp. 4228-RoL]MDT8896969.1 glycosyltransferase family 4 protein [Thermanaerothrix sp. 4228-RoL]